MAPRRSLVSKARGRFGSEPAPFLPQARGVRAVFEIVPARADWGLLDRHTWVHLNS